MAAVLLRKLSGVLLLLAAAGAGAAFGQHPDLARVEAIIVERTNDLRREHGLRPVDADARLEAAARYFAEYMARSDRYGHDADGKAPADRASRHGYDYCLVAENISYQYSSADFGTADLARRYVEGWKESPGHRRNMLAPAATDTAVAVARSAKSGRYYAVQMFGRPKALGVEFRISNAARETVSYRVAEEAFTLGPGATRIHTRCAPDEVSLVAARGTHSRTATPRNGERLTVIREPGGLALRAGG